MPIETIAALATTLAQWLRIRKQRREAKSQKTIEDYKEWLRRREHADLARHLEDNHELLMHVKQLIEDQALDSIDDQLQLERVIKQQLTIVGGLVGQIVGDPTIIVQNLPASPPPETHETVSGPRVSIGNLPTTGPHMFGRDDTLALLNSAWAEGHMNVITLVAAGGVGKSAVVNRCLAELGKDDYRPARRVYGHSFYSQGTSDKTASADTFIAAALEWFGDPAPEKGSPWAKGQRLAELIRAEPTLLILDGMEPLQYPPGPIEGRITDPALQALVRELSAHNPGLCVITTRQHVTDLDPFEGPGTRQVDLEDLSTEAGARLLEVLGVNGLPAELEEASEQFGNHALALFLLGTYLRKAHDGDVRKWREVRLTSADGVATGGHARRVMRSYEKWFKEHGRTTELSILRILGLFNRPAEGGCVTALREPPPIPDLTDGIVNVSESDWNIALADLRQAGLVAKKSTHAPDELDAHPLVREHFGEQLEKEYPEAWRAGHERLYEYLKGPGCSKYLPDTIEEMAPLFAAMTHGCAAGRHQEVFDDVYSRRINRGSEFFTTRKLGAFGAELGGLAGLFDEPWRRPSPALTDADRAFLLNAAGFHLRALGRLAEALEPTVAALERLIEQQHWVNAARSAENMSELLLTLGQVETAVDHARKGTAFAERSGETRERVFAGTTLGAALHQAGSVSEAEALFQEAERMQQDDQSEYRLLYSLQGYQYCDLLLKRGDHRDVIERATRTLAWAERQQFLLDIALDNLSLGRAYLLDAQAGRRHADEQAREHLNLAVDGLRAAGGQEFIPCGLLARAELHTFTGDYAEARADLDEALEIATRDPQGQMKLHVSDCHLGYARLALAPDDPATAAGRLADAREHLKQARELITETGYHRRDAELEDLERQVANG